MARWQIARMVLVLAVAGGIAACGPGATPSPSPSPTPRPTLTPTASPTAGPTVKATPTRAPSPVASAAPSATTYAVQKGDTLTSIAAKFHVTVDALQAANPQVTDPTKLQIGQLLKIP